MPLASPKNASLLYAIANLVVLFALLAWMYRRRSSFACDRLALALRAARRPVWLLGWVSFFTDTASEMIYPLLPLFLTRVLGAGAMSLGVIEGVAEAANSVLKIVSGRLADKTGTPKPLVLAGYGISSAVRPLIALAASWTHVLALRFADRLGKGIRGAPRDAMLADFAPDGQRGRVYGFHRAMDHAGAVLGPLLASALPLLLSRRVPHAVRADDHPRASS